MSIFLVLIFSNFFSYAGAIRETTPWNCRLFFCCCLLGRGVPYKLLTKTKQELGSVALPHPHLWVSPTFAPSRFFWDDDQMQDGLLPSVLRDDQSVCKSASRGRIQRIQLRLLKSPANKKHSLNMEKLPYIVSLSIFCNLLNKLIHIRSRQPDRIGPFAKKNQKRIHACSKATKSKRAISASDRWTRSTTIIPGSCIWRWGEESEQNVCPVWGNFLFEEINFGLSVLACSRKNLALLWRIRGPQQEWKFAVDFDEWVRRSYSSPKTGATLINRFIDIWRSLRNF